MHGVVKVRTSEEKAKALKLKELQKIKEYNELVQKFIDHRAQENGNYNEISLSLSKEVLQNNSEYYTIWNYRRLCIQQSPKSYWIWYHRKWISVRLDTCDWERELKLCSKLLDLDLRNFHCWSYRRFVGDRSNLPLEKEFEYTTYKIEQNFSNYSAWHQRSALLPKIYSNPHDLFEKLKEELELVRNAVFTEPKDSSSWIYHKWLVGTIKKIPDIDYKSVLNNELEQIDELIEMEPDCKWPIYISLLLKLDIGGFNSNDLQSELDKLKKLDPDHINYYNHLSNSIN
eukprot:gene7885-9704_t